MLLRQLEATGRHERNHLGAMDLIRREWMARFVFSFLRDRGAPVCAPQPGFYLTFEDWVAEADRSTVVGKAQRRTPSRVLTFLQCANLYQRIREASWRWSAPFGRFCFCCQPKRRTCGLHRLLCDRLCLANEYLLIMYRDNPSLRAMSDTEHTLFHSPLPECAEGEC